MGKYIYLSEKKRNAIYSAVDFIGANITCADEEIFNYYESIMADLLTIVQGKKKTEQDQD